jgi:hypothetical protein
MESVSDIFFVPVRHNYVLLIMVMVFGFLYASFDRLRIFHHNRSVQTVVALVLSLGTERIIHTTPWDEIAKIIVGLAVTGIVFMVVWSLAQQRGRTRQEEEMRHEEWMRNG